MSGLEPIDQEASDPPSLYAFAYNSFIFMLIDSELVDG
jgi:hypothetical protein